MSEGRSRSRSPVNRGSASPDEHRERRSRFSNDRGSGDKGDRRGNNYNRTSCRVLISNLSYEVKWQDLKDYFRDKVGEVAYVELFEENGKSSGRGVIEFRSPDLAKKAIDELHRSEYKGRNLVVKEFTGGDMPRDSSRGDRMGSMGMGMSMMNRGGDSSATYGNTYGLSPQFLESLGIMGALTTKLFVANLDYKVTEKKVKEVFALAGNVIKCQLRVDGDGKSKGQAVVEYEHPVEAVQAISMLNTQLLYDRKISVRMDKFGPNEEVNALPAGLKCIGLGLGERGQPLSNVTRLATGGTGAAMGGLGVGGGMGGLGMMGSGNMGGMGMGMGNDLGMGGGGGLGNFGGGLGNMGSNLGGSLGGSGLGGGFGGGSGMGLGSSNLGMGMMGMGNTSSGLGNLGSGLSSLGGGGGGFSSMGSSLGGGASSGVGGGYGSSGLNDLRGGRDFGSSSIDFNRSGNGNSNSTSNNKDSCVVVFRNLPARYTWQSLRDKCKEIAEVKFAEINRGIGAVRFASPQDAQRAVYKLDGITLEGSRIDVYLG